MKVCFVEYEYPAISVYQSPNLNGIPEGAVRGKDVKGGAVSVSQFTRVEPIRRCE